MSGLDKFHNVIATLNDQFTIDDEAIEELREILEEQHKHSVTTEQAEKVGRDLISMLETLANGRTIIAKKE